ncbi:MAG: CbiX/SirB N-terminal domain-containing protein [Deltaproteobacteria bacterium]|nr:CbiX/SirB N-terminal domain-containing protein [Deltaproteobacteria bacterium]
MNLDQDAQQENTPHHGKRAVIILGHGSRAAGAADDMEKVAARLRERIGYEIIATCQMSGSGALFPEVFDACIGQGASSILVLPYFLHQGIHLLQDVPEMMREKAAAFPGVKVVLGKNLGFDECLVDLVIKRLMESRSLPDILKLESQV